MEVTYNEDLYEVIPIVEGKKPTGWKKKVFVYSIVRAHNAYAEFTRPYYEKYNSEYDGPFDHLDENDCLIGASGSKYMKYLWDRINNELMPGFNKTYKEERSVFHHYELGDELELIGVMRNGCRISFLMKPTEKDV